MKFFIIFIIYSIFSLPVFVNAENINPNNLELCISDDVAKWNDCWGKDTNDLSSGLNDDGTNFFISYEGEFKSGKPEGVGSAVFVDGGSFVGIWENGYGTNGILKLPTQTGKFNIYEGEVRMVIPHGKGKFTFAEGEMSGQTLEACWDMGNFSGFIGINC